MAEHYEKVRCDVYRTRRRPGIGWRLLVTCHVPDMILAEHALEFCFCITPGVLLITTFRPLRLTLVIDHEKGWARLCRVTSRPRPIVYYRMTTLFESGVRKIEFTRIWHLASKIDFTIKPILAAPDLTKAKHFAFSNLLV